MSQVNNNGIGKAEGVNQNPQAKEIKSDSIQKAAPGYPSSGSSALGALGQVLVAQQVGSNNSVNREGVQKLFDALTLADTAIEVAGNDGQEAEKLYGHFLAV